MEQEKQERVPERLQPVYREIIKLTDAFCRERLTEEFTPLCRRMAAMLARKRPSPLDTGQVRVGTWAAGIVYTIGRINFMFDKGQPFYVSASNLSGYFGLAKNTVSSKSAEITRMLRIRPWDPDWMIPSMVEQNPMAWYISVNGLIIDARHAPREIQEIAYEKGLIPYIPAGRPRKEADRHSDG